ncbi:MAG: hypothetical protein WC617_02130 [Rhodanobacter sp.]|jgi:hypothetical protein
MYFSHFFTMRRHWIRQGGLAMALLLPMAGAMAADAHKAVQAKPGEMVLLRNVSTRPATRQAPAGMALIANPSPRDNLSAALGANELSDDDYANLDASSPGPRGARATTAERMVDSALDGSLGTSRNQTGGMTGNGFSNLIAGPTGAIGRTTGGIDNHIQGALSQLPGMTPTGGH